MNMQDALQHANDLQQLPKVAECIDGVTAGGMIGDMVSGKEREDGLWTSPRLALYVLTFSSCNTLIYERRVHEADAVFAKVATLE